MPLKKDCNCFSYNLSDWEKEIDNRVKMPINGKVETIDNCIHHIVAALNAGGIKTVASCCGHNKMVGNIILDDGRVLAIHPDFKCFNNYHHVTKE